MASDGHPPAAHHIFLLTTQITGSFGIAWAAADASRNAMMMARTLYSMPMTAQNGEDSVLQCVQAA